MCLYLIGLCVRSFRLGRASSGGEGRSVDGRSGKLCRHLLTPLSSSVHSHDRSDPLPSSYNTRKPSPPRRLQPANPPRPDLSFIPPLAVAMTAGCGLADVLINICLWVLGACRLSLPVDEDRELMVCLLLGVGRLDPGRYPRLVAHLEEREDADAYRGAGGPGVPCQGLLGSRGLEESEADTHGGQ